MEGEEQEVEGKAEEEGTGDEVDKVEKFFGGVLGGGISVLPDCISGRSVLDVFFLRETQMSPNCNCLTFRSYLSIVLSGLQEDQPLWKTKNGWSFEASTGI